MSLGYIFNNDEYFSSIIAYSIVLKCIVTHPHPLEKKSKTRDISIKPSKT